MLAAPRPKDVDTQRCILSRNLIVREYPEIYGNFCNFIGILATAL